MRSRVNKNERRKRKIRRKSKYMRMKMRNQRIVLIHKMRMNNNKCLKRRKVKRRKRFIKLIQKKIINRTK